MSAASADAFVTTLGSLAKGARSARYVPQAPADATFGGLRPPSRGLHGPKGVGGHPSYLSRSLRRVPRGLGNARVGRVSVSVPSGVVRARQTAAPQQADPRRQHPAVRDPRLRGLRHLEPPERPRRSAPVRPSPHPERRARRPPVDASRTRACSPPGSRPRSADPVVAAKLDRARDTTDRAVAVGARPPVPTSATTCPRSTKRAWDALDVRLDTLKSLRRQADDHAGLPEAFGERYGNLVDDALDVSERMALDVSDRQLSDSMLGIVDLRREQAASARDAMIVMPYLVTGSSTQFNDWIASLTAQDAAAAKFVASATPNEREAFTQAARGVVARGRRSARPSGSVPDAFPTGQHHAGRRTTRTGARSRPTSAARSWRCSTSSTTWRRRSNPTPCTRCSPTASASRRSCSSCSCWPGS